MKGFGKSTKLKGLPTLEAVEGEKERNLRSWKAAAWAPAIIGLIDIIYEVISHFFK